jgi:hypothetical protein
MPIPSGKPIWWRVIVGALLIVIQVQNQFFPAPNLLKASNPTQQQAMYATAAFLFFLGCWLLYTGAKSVWRKSTE